MSLESLSSEDNKKLTHLINEGIRISQQIEDLREGLKETVKAVAEEFEIKPAILNKAIKAAYKSNHHESKEELAEVENILHLVGRE